MSQNSFISLNTIRELIDSIGSSFAKSKAMAAIAVSCDLTEYNSDIISDYLNAMMQFNEEGQAYLADLHNYFLQLMRLENKLSEAQG